MSDPIKDALRAAAQAHRAERVASYAAWEPWAQLDSGEKAADVAFAAAAVAAFLRALPDDALLRLLSAEGDEQRGWRDSLAAAVEEAARDG